MNAVQKENHVLDYYLDVHLDILYHVVDLSEQISDFDMVCELVNIIFDYNQDRLCGLKQYTGGMVKDSKENKKYQKTL